MIKTPHVEDILPLIDNDTWFFVDLDNCMFEAAQALGHANWFYDEVQRRVQNGMTRDEAIRDAYPAWIETQKICSVKPLEENFIPILSMLQEKGIVMMGLTHRQPLVADATIRQVNSLGFDFSKTSPPLQNEFVSSSQTPSIYSQGILFVGDYNQKIDALTSFFSATDQKPKKVVFIDDNPKNIAELENLNALGIGYHGVHYTAIEHKPPVYIPEIAQFQFNFKTLKKNEDWNEIISQGTLALHAARISGTEQEEAKICAKLASTAFYQGDYLKALEYANRCHELSETFEDLSLFIRALYLESAVHRALANKKIDEADQDESYSVAIKIAQQAALFYEMHAVNDPSLQGKIYFNLGAAHADNPRGDLSQALAHYSLALHSFKTANAVDDWIRTKVRLGKVYLLQKNYRTAESLIEEVRLEKLNERIGMQVDYLEAQLKFVMGETSSAIEIAKQGLDRAEKLGAKEDKRRFASLLAQ